MGEVAKLILTAGGRREVPITEEAFLIGRSKECHLVFEGNGNASRKHAQIRRVGAQWLITDLGSGNGTRVNGQAIREVPLGDGDRIEIGGVEMQFVHPGAARRAAPPASQVVVAHAPVAGTPAPAFAPVSPPPVPRTPPTARPVAPPAAAARPPEPGTEAYDMARVLQGAAQETAAYDTPRGVLLETAEMQRASARNKVLVPLAVAGVFLVGLLLVFAGREPAKPPGPKLEPYAKVTCNVNDFAYVTLEHIRATPRDPAVAKVNSTSDGTNEIAIQGLRPGQTVVEVLAEEKKGWLIDVTVIEREIWPTGWTQDDRLGAAEKLKHEADVLFGDIQGYEAGMVSVFHMYKKVLRLYDNCEFYPPEAYEQAKERADGLEQQIKAKEKEYLLEFRRQYYTGKYAEAENMLNELLALFPEDGTEGNLLKVHGDTKKYRQYFLLREKIRMARRGR